MGSFPKIDSDMEPFSAHIYELFGSMPYWPVLFMKLVGSDMVHFLKWVHTLFRPILQPIHGLFGSQIHLLILFSEMGLRGWVDFLKLVQMLFGPILEHSMDCLVVISKSMFGLSFRPIDSHHWAML